MSGMRIHILRCGWISVTPELCYGAGSWSAAQLKALTAPERRRIKLPVFAYLIESPHGLLLADTGWSRAVSPDGRLNMGALRRHTSGYLASTYRGWVEPGMTAREQLAAMGISPRDIDCVFLMSLDADHVSGLASLTGAKRLLAAEEEMWWSYRTNPNHCVKLYDGLPETYYFRGTNTGPDGRSYDIFGDESMVAVSTPGHTKGTVALRIGTPESFVLLVGDNGYGRRSWRDIAVPGLGFNLKAQKASLEWIMAQSELPGCRAILASHDPEVSPGIIEI